jgi:hypothetical protein
MSDIVERLQNMFFRFGGESPEDAANRRIQTAKDAADEIEKLRAEIEKLREAALDALASLVAAHSLLKRGGKKAAPSDKMFEQMLCDYDATITRARAVLGEKQ